jgi:hypothetical protein
MNNSMDNKKPIRKYYDSYVKYFPEKWEWRPYVGTPEEQSEWNKIYLATRARKSKSFYKNDDLSIPDFYSLERDAEQFELDYYEFTDTFGLKWEGRKGIYKLVGAPDYEGHLYYDSFDGEDVEISEYNDNDNPPDPDVYQCFDSSYHSRREWIDIKNIVAATYHYVVENHLFKDTYIDIAYGEGQHERIYEDHYRTFINALTKFNKLEILQNIFTAMDEHFEKLKNSDREDERAYWPGMKANEYFQMN